MRRSLVLVDETARHPFLQNLPPHVRSGARAVPRVPNSATRLDTLRQFLLAYCACFVAASVYFA
jgi:hypothetical protein